MITIQKTDTIVTDTETLLVADLPLEIQQAVMMLDDWREREVNSASELQMIRTAVAAGRDSLRDSIIAYFANRGVVEPVAETIASANIIDLPPEATAAK